MTTNDNIQIINGLNARQIEAVNSLDGETLVLAGAGSGKTAVLTRRCANLIINGAVPGSILSLTFTNKAAKEMNDRMRKLLIAMGYNLPINRPWENDYSNTPLFCTFHALGVRLLREFVEEAGLKPGFSILDSDDVTKMIKAIIKELAIDDKALTASLVSYFIGQCKQELLLPERSKRLSKEFLPVFHKIYAIYARKCSESNVVDFDDLILKTYFLLKDYPELRSKLQQRWQHIQVDEFQDINLPQFKIISLLYEV
jgi:DNA helicase II / ATP-dependent DNA helicase PcrA